LKTASELTNFKDHYGAVSTIELIDTVYQRL